MPARTFTELGLQLKLNSQQVDYAAIEPTDEENYEQNSDHPVRKYNIKSNSNANTQH